GIRSRVLCDVAAPERHGVERARRALVELQSLPRACHRAVAARCRGAADAGVDESRADAALGRDRLRRALEAPHESSGGAQVHADVPEHAADVARPRSHAAGGPRRTRRTFVHPWQGETFFNPPAPPQSFSAATVTINSRRRAFALALSF